MSCWNITEIIRRARTVGVIIELDEAGNLRLRAPNQPPQAMVQQHLREHKQELVAFLRAKAAAEDSERRMAASQRKQTSRGREFSKAARQDGAGSGAGAGDTPFKARNMTARSLVRQIADAGGRVWLKGEAVRIAASGPLPNAIVEQLRRDKPEVVEVLRLLPVCYECGAKIIQPVSTWWGRRPVHFDCGERAWRARVAGCGTAGRRGGGTLI